MADPTRNQLLGAAVAYLRERKGLTQDSVAQEMGLSRASVSKKEAGRERFDAGWWPRLAKALGLTEAKLQREIDRVIEERPLGYRFSELQAHTRTRVFPVQLHSGAASRGAKDPPLSAGRIHAATDDSEAFTFEIVDDSMSPQFIEGDVVVLSPAAEVRDGDACLVLRDSGSSLRLVFRVGDKLELRPINQRRHQSAVIAASSAHLVKAVGCYRRVG